MCLKINVDISLRGHDISGALFTRFSTSLGEVGLINIEFLIAPFRECIGDICSCDRYVSIEINGNRPKIIIQLIGNFLVRGNQCAIFI